MMICFGMQARLHCRRYKKYCSMHSGFPSDESMHTLWLHHIRQKNALIVALFLGICSGVTHNFFDSLKTKPVLYMNMAKQEIRTVNGNKYLYYTHYEGGSRLIVYCGPAFRTKSKIKGTKLELNHTLAAIKQLEKKKKSLDKKLSKLCKDARRPGQKKRDTGTAK